MATRRVEVTAWGAVALAALTFAVVGGQGCVAESDPGPGLNPQPLPPEGPPRSPPGEDTSKEGNQAPTTGAGEASSGSSGSSGVGSSNGGDDDASKDAGH